MILNLKWSLSHDFDCTGRYFSTNYADKGYLFLMVDLRNPKEPIIHVRTWQPEKDPNGKVFGIEDFKFD